MSNDPNQTSQLELDQEAVCAKVAEDLINNGRLIQRQEAVDSIANYFREPGIPPQNDNNHIYGHTFGLNKIREFLSEIDKHNTTAGEGSKIHGVRVYYGKSSRRNYPEYKGKQMRDLIFMPVLGDGVDIYKVHSLEPGDIILAEGRPCPNECGSNKFKFIE